MRVTLTSTFVSSSDRAPAARFPPPCCSRLTPSHFWLQSSWINSLSPHPECGAAAPVEGELSRVEVDQRVVPGQPGHPRQYGVVLLAQIHNHEFRWSLVDMNNSSFVSGDDLKLNAVRRNATARRPSIDRLNVDWDGKFDLQELVFLHPRFVRERCWRLPA